jgi:SagB-type dehydrogenase family enzyme
MESRLLRYLTPSGTPEAEKERVESFHEATKWSHATMCLSERTIRLHLYDARAVLEASRNLKRYVDRPLQPLDKPISEHSFLNLSRARVSCRQFDGSLLSEEQTSTLLAALRVTRTARSLVHPDATMHFRAYPSAGGLYPIEAYFGMPIDGRQRWRLNHYAPLEHGQHVLGDWPTSRLKAALQDQQGLCAGAGLVVLLSAILRRSTVKYGPTGYRFALIEAGAVTQQLVLAATSLGLASLVWGSALDDEVNEMLGLDGVNETLIITVFIGGAADA